MEEVRCEVWRQIRQIPRSILLSAQGELNDTFTVFRDSCFIVSAKNAHVRAELRSILGVIGLTWLLLADSFNSSCCCGRKLAVCFLKGSLVDLRVWFLESTSYYSQWVKKFVSCCDLYSEAELKESRDFTNGCSCSLNTSYRKYPE